MLTEQMLRRGLKTKRFGNKIYTFDTIDSTNNCARALAACWADEGTVVIAEQQTAGRGRLGRSWIANPQENLTFSVVLRPTAPPAALNLLPLYVAVAVAEAVETVAGVRPEVKWPNDILVNGKKAAGILLEGSIKQDSLEYVVVGIGVNVNQVHFPAEIEQTATSLQMEASREIDRLALFREILVRLEYHYKTLSSSFEQILSLWLARCAMINREIAVSERGNVMTGIMKGVNKEGALVLETEGKEHALFAGDVTVVKA